MRKAEGDSVMCVVEYMMRAIRLYFVYRARVLSLNTISLKWNEKKKLYVLCISTLHLKISSDSAMLVCVHLIIFELDDVHIQRLLYTNAICVLFPPLPYGHAEFLIMFSLSSHHSSSLDQCLMFKQKKKREK